MNKNEKTIKSCGGIQPTHTPVHNNITELVFILDKSGSMEGLEDDTIGGFNSMIEKQRSLDGECFVSTILFDNESTVLHDRIDLSNVPKMTKKDYVVGGCTALVDALADAINHIGNIHKYARPTDVPERTMFIITTDGEENASHRYTSDKLKSMIDRQKNQYGWEFLFIGANIDAVETAKSIGISPERAVNYNADSVGTKILYSAVAKAITCIRNDSELSPKWSEEIDNDHKTRKNQRN